MSNLSHLGKNVWVLDSMPFGGYGYRVSPDSLVALEKKIKQVKFKYLIAVTANKFQEKAAEVLKKNKFKPQVTFKSSHNISDETLTLWLKVNKSAKASSDKPINKPGGNCSVTYDRYDSYRCGIAVKKDGETLPTCFSQMGKTPIWWYVNKHHIVENFKFKFKKNKGNKVVNSETLKPINLFK